MNKYSLLICFQLALSTLLAQTPYHPMLVEGRSWDIFIVPGEMSVCGYAGAHHFFLKGDTILDGLTYKKVNFNLIRSNPASPFCEGFYRDTTEAYLYALFFREDSLARKVFMRMPDQPEFAIFDFSLQAGDTLHYPTHSYPIEEVFEVVLANGEQRKAFRINAWMDNFYIEGVGYLLGAFNPVFEPLEGWNQTTCVRDGDQIIYSNENNGGPGCIMATSNTTHPELAAFKISPNPVRDHLLVEFNGQARREDLYFEFFDLTSRLVFHKTLELGANSYSFDLATLPPGVYYWSINGKFGGKLIKI